MKVTRGELKRIIKEEVHRRYLQESAWSDAAARPSYFARTGRGSPS
jgi:hypothetical protein